MKENPFRSRSRFNELSIYLQRIQEILRIIFRDSLGATGFILLGVFILMAIAAKVALFDWLVTMLVYYTTYLTIVPPPTRFTAGILLLGTFGFVLFCSESI
jgi:hypothetical protein